MNSGSANKNYRKQQYPYCRPFPKFHIWSHSQSPPNSDGLGLLNSCHSALVVSYPPQTNPAAGIAVAAHNKGVPATHDAPQPTTPVTIVPTPTPRVPTVSTP